MSKRFIELTTGWIPIAVLMLFAAALVTEQAGASLPSGLLTVPAPAAPETPHSKFEGPHGREVEDIAIILKSIFELPSDVRLILDATILVPDTGAGAPANGALEGEGR